MVDMRRAEARDGRREGGGGRREEGGERGALSLQNKDPTPQDGWENVKRAAHANAGT